MEKCNELSRIFTFLGVKKLDSAFHFVRTIYVFAEICKDHLCIKNLLLIVWKNDMHCPEYKICQNNKYK